MARSDLYGLPGATSGYQHRLDQGSIHMAENASQSTQDSAPETGSSNGSSAATPPAESGPPQWFKDWEARNKPAAPATPAPQPNQNSGSTVAHALMQRLDAIPR